MRYPIANFVVFTFASLMLAFSCQKEQVFTGELGFKLVDIGSIQDIKDKEGNSIIEFLENLNDKELSSEELQLKEYYEFLKENTLLNYKKFYLVRDEVIYSVYVTPNEFDKIKEYNLNKLRDNHKKIILNISGFQINDKAIKATQINNIKEVEGVTFWSK